MPWSVLLGWLLEPLDSQGPARRHFQRMLILALSRPPQVFQVALSSRHGGTEPFYRQVRLSVSSDQPSLLLLMPAQAAGNPRRQALRSPRDRVSRREGPHAIRVISPYRARVRASFPPERGKSTKKVGDQRESWPLRSPPGAESAAFFFDFSARPPRRPAAPGRSE
jgi:hypothetical protein